MSRHLKQELTVPALMQQLPLVAVSRKSAQHEWSRCEAEVLVRILTPGANQSNDLHPLHCRELENPRFDCFNNSRAL
jgi:hypothetical protein